MHQILERHVPGQTLVNAPRQIAHLGQLFQQDPVAFLFVLFVLAGGIDLHRILAHGSVSASVSALLLVAPVVVRSGGQKTPWLM
jgi:hypothetical protein